MAQNEMKAMRGMPLRVRSMEGLALGLQRGARMSKRWGSIVHSIHLEQDQRCLQTTTDRPAINCQPNNATNKRTQGDVHVLT